MIENKEQFNDLYLKLVGDGQVLPSQCDSLELLWEAAWDLGSDAAYDLGYCDGVSSERDDNQKTPPGKPIDLTSVSHVVGL